MGQDIHKIETEYNLGWRLYFYAIADASLLQQARENALTKASFAKSSGPKQATRDDIRRLSD